MNIRLPAALLLLLLAACATAPSTLPSRSPNAKPPAVNLSGFPPEFRAGYSDGCASVNAARQRDEARFKTDTNYAQGWRDGYDICRRRK
jgi:hypothetical protein